MLLSASNQETKVNTEHFLKIYIQIHNEIRIVKSGTLLSELTKKKRKQIIYCNNESKKKKKQNYKEKKREVVRCDSVGEFIQDQ